MIQITSFTKAYLCLGHMTTLYIDVDSNEDGQWIYNGTVWQKERDRFVIDTEIAAWREVKDWFHSPYEEITEEEAEKINPGHVTQGKRLFSRNRYLYIKYRARYKANTPVKYNINGPLTIISGETSPCPTK